ncbi:MAG TPA: hypothetical protein VIV15_00570 [Anaerolineales bacterium]
MTKHLTEGELRAAVDGEAEAKAAAHLSACPECRDRLRQIEAHAEFAGRRLDFMTPADESRIPNSAAAWNRFSQQIALKKENPMLKRLFSFPVVRFGVSAVLILALVLAFPATRALAGELLNLFRVQQVTVIPVDFTGLEQLTGDGTLGSQFTSLISESMEMSQKPGAPVVAANAEEASKVAGFNLRLPTGTQPSQIYVTGRGAFSFTVDRTKAQALLDEAGRSDLVLPQSVDGARISVTVPASVSVGYGTCPSPSAIDSDKPGSEINGRRYPDCVILAEIPSPTVDAPADVNVAELARLGLEFTGMSPEEAAAFTSSVDWASTLVIPIPKNAAIYKQVEVDGVTGTLIQRPADDAPQYALLWVKDGIVYAISGLGTNSQQAIDMANSIP